MTLSTTDVSALLHAIEKGEKTFADVITFIESNYHYSPVAFVNGEVSSPAGTNEGSAKVFAFAKLNGLNQLDTLALFCEHYKSVQATPNGTDHANIRNFLYYGWQGFDMPINALTPR